MTTRVSIDWGTDSPELAEQLKAINDLPEYTSARQELEGALHAFMARICWQRAAIYKDREDDRAARQKRSAERKAAKEAASG